MSIRQDASSDVSKTSIVSNLPLSSDPNRRARQYIFLTHLLSSWIIACCHDQVKKNILPRLVSAMDEIDSDTEYLLKIQKERQAKQTGGKRVNIDLDPSLVPPQFKLQPDAEVQLDDAVIAELEQHDNSSDSMKR